MKTIAIDDYVLDALMRDLIGRDKSPSAFAVYLFLWRRARERGAAHDVEKVIAVREASRGGLQVFVGRPLARHRAAEAGEGDAGVLCVAPADQRVAGLPELDDDDAAAAAHHARHLGDAFDRIG